MEKKINIPFLIFLIITIAFPIISFAQENTVEMADIMHENGKIFVVIAVISVILTGFLVALISIDKRVKRMEKDSKKE